MHRWCRLKPRGSPLPWMRELELFHNRELRRGVLEQLASWKGVMLPPGIEIDLDAEYDKLADLVRENVDMTELYRVAGLA